jgi:predicted O-methyltransferase YrrM
LTKFDEVTERFGEVKYMGRQQADFLREFIRKRDLRDLLEIGFYQGKSSAYIAAILEDRGGAGHLTTIDRLSAKDRSPSIDDLLGALDLSDRVTPVWAERSYTWELGRMVKEGKRELFDFCYFDGGHTWDLTGFGFVLVDMLLKPGGWIIFDDLDWTLGKSEGRQGGTTGSERYSEDELGTATVRMVFDTLVPYLGYGSRSEQGKFRWGIARKPQGGRLSRVRGALPI